MATQQQRATKRVAEMDWSTFAGNLPGATRGATSPNARAIQDTFDKDELKELRELSEHAAARRAAPKAGTVILLPGIMGSNLATVGESGDEDVVWVNVLRLIRGRVDDLRLNENGKPLDTPEVRVVGVDKRTYAKAVLWLQARWNVETFAYDWRLDIDSASRALAELIERKFPNQPVHLVAHSMGGLVSRNFIRLFEQRWAGMLDGAGNRGGRLIMLGTPNFGSYAIPQALTGEEKLVRWLAAADLTHNLDRVLEVLNSFVGSYEMLPAPSKLPVGAQVLYRSETWNRDSVSGAHLERAMQFHADLSKAGTVDPARMAYIAGSGIETLSGLNVLSSGEFTYSTTPYGDGRVPHSLGLLEGVPTYYVEEVHGDLPRNSRVLAAVDELLETGKTTALPMQAPPTRTVRKVGARWRRPASEKAKAEELRRIARKAEAGTASDAEVRYAEEEVTRAVTGRGERSLDTGPSRAGAPGRPRAPRERELSLTVELAQEDITKVRTPVMVAGHYRGVVPIRAVGALDDALQGWIGDIQARGIMSADLGEVFFIPTYRQLSAQAIMLAGMGEAGHFTRQDLRFLIANVVYAIGSLGVTSFASVLVGSGTGSLPRDVALRAFIGGIADGMRRLGGKHVLRKVTLVELDGKGCAELKGLLAKYKHPTTSLEERRAVADTTGPDGTWFIEGLHVRKQLPARIDSDRQPAATTGKQQSPTPDGGTRITVEYNDNRFRYSAMTDRAVVPVREVPVKKALARSAAQRLMDATTAEDQEQFGRLLATRLMPEEFQGQIERGPLTLILDRSTASYPWEMACIRSASGARYFGTTLRLTRQFRSMLSRPAGMEPENKEELCVLVIADPAQDPELQLPGARAEGRAVVKVLEEYKPDAEDRRPIRVVSRIGAAECDPVEILALILGGDFHVIHYAGHGVFDEHAPDESGWVFARDMILSPADIFQARRVPHLVFANACFSAGIADRPAMTADEADARLAGLAEAFFNRGVRNFIGAGWPVDDRVAVEVATNFYDLCLKGQTLSDSLSAARESAQHTASSTWGAYQQYGSVTATLPLWLEAKVAKGASPRRAAPGRTKRQPSTRSTRKAKPGRRGTRRR